MPLNLAFYLVVACLETLRRDLLTRLQNLLKRFFLWLIVFSDLNMTSCGL